MWGILDRAKEAAARLEEAAANIDKQLNESVGVEAPASTKPAAVTSSSAAAAAAATTASGIAEKGEVATNVWNDDDFKFDDDDDDDDIDDKNDEVAFDTAAATTPALTPIEPATAQEAAEESNPADSKISAKVPSEETQADAPEESAKEETQTEQAPTEEQRTTETTKVEASAEIHNESVQGKPAVPGTPASTSSFFGKYRDKVQNSMHANDINFMSPLSSLISSIPDNDHNGQRTDNDGGGGDDDDDDDVVPSAAEKDENVPVTPLKQSVAAPTPAGGDGDDDDDDRTDKVTAAEAWQDDGDINLEDVDANDKENGERAKEDIVEERNNDEEKLPIEKQETTIFEPEIPKKEIQPEIPSLGFQAAVDGEALAEPETTAQSEPPKTESPVLVEDPADKSDPESPSLSEAAPMFPTHDPTATAPPADYGPSVPSAELESVKKLLAQREEQLEAKAQQMFELEQMFEKEKQDLLKKVADTKEEAKKRIGKARERCEQVEAKLQASTSALSEDAAEQAKVIAALREEGGKLAQKQAEMERMVRTARGEARELKEKLEYETTAKVDALEKIEKLKAELKVTQDNLSSARKGETQAGKLDAELQSAKEENAFKANTIMSLEQNVKELKTENKRLVEEVESAMEGAAVEKQEEYKKLRKEHNSMIAELEAKLEKTEKEAVVREDSLRLEVEELRKRWQDAVRRADALSMDVQSSTAPLLRQLESMERQQRARTSAAAELENKLRTELEETIIEHEKMTKDYTELKTKHGRLERQSKEQQSDLEEGRRTIDELSTKMKRLEQQLETLQVESEKKKEEYAEVERLANEGVSKVRSEMSTAVLESEERYRSQLETMKAQLKIENEKRLQLEQQVDQLLENAAAMIPESSNEYVKKESKPAKLKQSQGQADILQSALGGLGADSGDEHDEDTDDEDATPMSQLNHQSSGSYAALEQLTSNLRTAKNELETLRAQLKESERVRESLLADLSECREAKEKLPLFEARVQELSTENREKKLEVQALREDIAEVREMYRTQMSALLEEKAAAFAEVAKATGYLNRVNAEVEDVKKEPPLPELVEDMF